MNIVIPTEHGNIAAKFDICQEFTLYAIEAELVLSKQQIFFQGTTPADWADFLKKYAIHLVISDGISSMLKSMLREKRIELIFGITGEADEILRRYLSGEDLEQLQQKRQQMFHTKVPIYHANIVS